MSCRLSVFFALFFVGGQSIYLAHAPSFPLLPFDFPEIDGSAVGTCRISPVPVPFPDPTTSVTTTTTAPTTITRKQVVATTKKPAVQSPPRKPETRNTGTPIRPQPAPAGPITNSHSNHINSLLHYLLANSRRHAAGSLPGLISQPIGRLPNGAHSSSDSDDLATTLLKTVGRREEKRWKIGSLSSEDSSDES